ncbi:hypothetical protein SRB5_06780 [Streptomyces sp. RB5]|uniref:Deoxyribonuclease NucA/NucB domain-containing protein n=1 Tax=Streptomyces smaragdinus TaxID=2585196 RepID=A0A7K0CAT7_9ACTN|nr:NucA/NucB deoxyribonuclease domain-containing protein [Streptomyces smaragdinus]MQY10567.1 hypothetical protein [Streptomyces smaragdinus]
MKPVVMDDAEYRANKADGTLDRSDWTVVDSASVKSEPLTEDRANAELAEAPGAVDKSYGDTSAVPLRSASSGVRAPSPRMAAPPTSWSTTPTPDAETCLGRDRANQSGGLTFNRWTWCHRMRIGFQYWEVDGRGIPVEYEGTNSLVADVAAVGSGVERGIRTYLRAEEGSVSYDDWDVFDRWFTAPDLHMYILSDCDGTPDRCHGSGSGVEHTWSDWDYRDEWLYWDIYSHEDAATGADRVLYHNWFFRFGGGDDDEYKGPEGRTDSWQIRCDSANYFSYFGVDYAKACVNYNVIPHLIYKVSDDRVEAVARHIRFAQDDPTRTYPVEIGEERKDIPGKYTGVRDGRGLTRVPYQGIVYSANEDWKNRACQRREPYGDAWGLPPYDTGTHDCDEYPFAVTNEGAASRNFSVRAVPREQNRAAGGLLRWYLFADRILYNSDPFWVEIQD